MYIQFTSIMRLGIILLAFASISANGVRAEEKQDMGGWGVDDPYHGHYRAVKFEKFKARVLKVKEVIPMPGMAPGVAIDVKMEAKRSRKIIEVQICPTWFARPDDIGIRKGDRVNIRGVRAMINDKEVIMASKIKKEDYFELKVRFTRDGTPFWTLTPEEVFTKNIKKNSENGD